jgi:hypothetical protein
MSDAEPKLTDESTSDGTAGAQTRGMKTRLCRLVGDLRGVLSFHDGIHLCSTSRSPQIVVGLVPPRPPGTCFEEQGRIAPKVSKICPTIGFPCSDTKMKNRLFPVPPNPAMSPGWGSSWRPFFSRRHSFTCFEEQGRIAPKVSKICPTIGFPCSDTTRQTGIDSIRRPTSTGALP